MVSDLQWHVRWEREDGALVREGRYTCESDARFFMERPFGDANIHRAVLHRAGVFIRERRRKSKTVLPRQP